MTSILWILYLADVIHAVSFAAGLGAVISIAVLGSVSIMNETLNYLKKWWWVPVSFFVLLATIPSKNLMYLIAAEQVAGKVVDSDLGKKVISLVHKKLDEELSKAVK